MPSRARLATAVSVGHISSADRWSVTTRFCSSGIDLSNERSPASTWPSGMPSFAAASAPASVVVVSP